MKNNVKHILTIAALGVGGSLIIRTSYEIGRIVGAVQAGSFIIKEMTNFKSHSYTYQHKEEA